MSRQNFSSGTVWESMAGYSRAVRVGNQIFVAGTTAAGPDGPVGGDDPAAQTRFGRRQRPRARGGRKSLFACRAPGKTRPQQKLKTDREKTKRLKKRK